MQQRGMRCKMAEMKSDPNWVPNKEKAGATKKIKLLEGKPKATGTNSYGQWNLWLIEVENATVVSKETKEVTQGYTGKATFFPNENVHKQLMEFTNGTKEGVEINMTKVFKEGEKGPYTSYEIELAGDGSTPASILSEKQLGYINSFKKFVDMGIIEKSQEGFVKLGSVEPYNLSEDTLNKLWNVYKEDN
jgi:hypothetical protein